MNFLKYFIYINLTFIIFILFIFINIGKYLDISESPKESDIIVSLGGGKDLERLKESIYLYNSDYSKKSILLLTGDNRTKKEKINNIEDNRIKYIKNINHKNLNIIHKSTTKNTEEEIKYIFKFMNKNKYKSALIISDPPHSKRISYLTKYLNQGTNTKLIFTISTSNVKWWDKNYPYKNKKSQIFTISEILKIINITMKYTLYNYGYREVYNNYIYNISTYVKSLLGKINYYYFKE